MKTITRYASLIAVGSLLSSTALLAETASNTSSSAGNAAGSNPSPTYSATTNATGDSRSTTSSPTLNSPRSNATAPGLLNEGSTMSGSAFSGATDPLSSALQTADYNTRSATLGEVERQLEAQKDQLKTTKKLGKDLDGDAKSNFKAAWDDLESREKDLKRSLKDARNASADRWESARSQLAANYQAYLGAVSRAQTSSTNGLSSNPSMNGAAGASSSSSADRTR